MINLLDYFYENEDTFLVNPDVSGRDLYVIKYLHSGVDWTKPWALDARGLVINSNGDIISRPYRKFFGHKQLDIRVDQPEEIRELSNWSEGMNYTVTEKLDGSLVVISWYDGELLITSSGSSTNEYIDAFAAWINHHLTEQNIQVMETIAQEYTLMFEYVAPTNQIVIPYKKSRIVFHGMVETQTAHVITDRSLLELMASNMGVDIAKQYDYTLEELKDLQETEKGIEGYVVTFENGHRLKFKTAEYVELHAEVSLFLGKVLTKRKLEQLIQLCIDDELDDVFTEAERRQNHHLAEVAIQVENYYTDFYDKVTDALSVAHSPGFDRKKYVEVYGSKSWDSIIVLSLANGRYTNLTKLMKRYIKENVIADYKDMEETK